MNPTYVCPMHPEIQQDKPGQCPKCGMNLVLKGDNSMEQGIGKLGWKNYLPLLVVIGLLCLTTLTLSFRDAQTNSVNLTKTLSYFMIGFFLTFSGFKLLNLKGFAQGYATYDLLSKRFFVYGYIYPFIELFFGLSMIIAPQSNLLLLSEFVVMAFSGLGVALKIAKKEKFQCACLGTFLKVPLTKVTLIEDFGMATLALILIFR